MKVGPQILRRNWCHDNVPWGSKKEGRIYNLRPNTYHLLKKIVKIGPVEPKWQRCNGASVSVSATQRQFNSPTGMTKTATRGPVVTIQLFK